MSSDSAIETHDLSRRFRRKNAVQNLTLRVPTGSVFAFLGPNGAGKTTTIKMLMSILRASSGSGTVLGGNIQKLRPDIVAQVGYVSENQKMPDWMTVGGLLNYCKPWYPTWDDALCERLLRQFDLPLDRKLKHLSRGMKTKAELLSVLAFRPKLLMLDEPFSGLDPLVRDEFIRGVLELTEQEQWTIFVSSHDIDEVERLANWVGIINNGRLELCESVVGLQSRFRRVEVVLAGDSTATHQALPSDCLLPEVSGRTVRFIDSAATAHEREDALRRLFPSDVRMTATPMSLREIFLALARQFRLVEGGGAK